MILGLIFKIGIVKDKRKYIFIHVSKFFIHIISKIKIFIILFHSYDVDLMKTSKHRAQPLACKKKLGHKGESVPADFWILVQLPRKEMFPADLNIINKVQKIYWILTKIQLKLNRVHLYTSEVSDSLSPFLLSLPCFCRLSLSSFLLSLCNNGRNTAVPSPVLAPHCPAPSGPLFSLCPLHSRTVSAYMFSEINLLILDISSWL